MEATDKAGGIVPLTPGNLVTEMLRKKEVCDVLHTLIRKIMETKEREEREMQTGGWMGCMLTYRLRELQIFR